MDDPLTEENHDENIEVGPEDLAGLEPDETGSPDPNAGKSERERVCRFEEQKTKKTWKSIVFNPYVTYSPPRCVRRSENSWSSLWLNIVKYSQRNNIQMSPLQLKTREYIEQIKT